MIEGQKRYLIPVFQRSYEWDDDLWEPLWDDINSLADEHDSKSNHFIGPIVTLSTAVPYDISKHLVIDGQQRLMTIFIFLSALRDRARNLDLISISKAIENTELFFLTGDGDQMSKIVPRIRDKDILEEILKGNHHKTNPTSLIHRAYTFFAKKIESSTRLQGTLFEKQNPEEQIKKLRHAATQRLNVVAITLGQNDNPSNIYESLNFKTEKLSDAALIRNYVFMQLETLEEQEAFNEKNWGPFEEEFKHPDKSKDRLTDFYYHYLIAQNGYLARKRLYSMFTKYVDNYLKKGTPEQLSNTLRLHAKYYVAIVESAPDKDIENALKRFRQLETDTAIPLVLDFYARYKGELEERPQITKSTFLNFLEILESFILRRFIMRERSRGYGPDFAIARSDHAKNLTTLIRYFAHKGLPDDEQIKKALQGFEFYKRSSKKCRLVLVEIERSYQHKERVDLDDPKEISIDHIMPQKLTLDWQDSLGEKAEDIHQRLLHVLGNLTLTGYNSKGGNKPFGEKKHKSYIDSNLQLNKDIIRHNKWTESEIEERTIQLAEKFVSIWKRPSI